MHSAYHATLVVTRASLDSLDDCLRGLSNEAVLWAPLPGMNTIAVLTRHAVTSTAFLAACGAGLAPDRQTYLQDDRAAAFATRAASVGGLRAEVRQLLDDIGPILGGGSGDVLERPAAWSWPGGRTPKCGELLIHSVAHLNQHVGHVQLVRDLWNATRGAGA